VIYPNGTRSVTMARADSFTVLDTTSLELLLDVAIHTVVWAGACARVCHPVHQSFNRLLVKTRPSL
jgi:hypothetical protein